MDFSERSDEVEAGRERKVLSHQKLMETKETNAEREEAVMQ